MTIQAEQALIGTILTENRAFELVSEIDAIHFTTDAHRAIYKALQDDLKAGKVVDAITVMKSLGDRLNDFGGMQYLTTLSLCAVSIKNAPRYAEIILDEYSRRQLKSISFAVMRNLDEQMPTNEIVGQIAEGLNGLTKKSETVATIDDSLLEHVDLMSIRSEGNQKSFSTGLTALDKKLNGGFCAGDLVVLAARPAMGKTMCALTIALNAAENGNVLFFSLEMSRAQLLDRAVANIGGLPLSWIRNPHEEGPEWDAYTAAIARMKNLGLVIDDRAGRRIHEIESIAKQENRKKRLSLVVVDYLGLIRGSSSQNRNTELGEYTKTLKGLAKSLDCPLLLLAQLNRGMEQRTSKRPLMSDLRDSGEIEADADIVMTLYRDEYYNPNTRDRGVVEIDVAKYRQGETGVIGCAFQGQYQRFADLGHEYKREIVETKVNTRGLD